MTRLWHHLSGTLRALLASFKAQYVICRPVRQGAEAWSVGAVSCSRL